MPNTMVRPPALPEDPRDTEHIRTLVICHYVMAGLGFLGLLGLLLHFMLMQKVVGGLEEIPISIENIADPGISDEETPIKADQERRQRQAEETQKFVRNSVSSFSGFFMIFYVVIGILILAIMILNLVSARLMASRKGKAFSIFVSAINCLNIPLGTILGVFTIVILSRTSVAGTYR